MEKTIENLAGYVIYIQEVDKDYTLSRGQGQDKVLLPSVFRLDERNMRLFSNATAKEFIEEFKNNSVLYLDNHTRNIENEFEWIILAQHFGVPTCLLDFTYSHMVSLMFALKKAFDYSEAGLQEPELIEMGGCFRVNMYRNTEIAKESMNTATSSEDTLQNDASNEGGRDKFGINEEVRENYGETAANILCLRNRKTH